MNNSINNNLGMNVNPVSGVTPEINNSGLNNVNSSMNTSETNNSSDSFFIPASEQTPKIQPRNVVIPNVNTNTDIPSPVTPPTPVNSHPVEAPVNNVNLNGNYGESNNAIPNVTPVVPQPVMPNVVPTENMNQVNYNNANGMANNMFNNVKPTNEPNVSQGQNVNNFNSNFVNNGSNFVTGNPNVNQNSNMQNGNISGNWQL